MDESFWCHTIPCCRLTRPSVIGGLQASESQPGPLPASSPTPLRHREGTKVSVKRGSLQLIKSQLPCREENATQSPTHTRDQGECPESRGLNRGGGSAQLGQLFQELLVLRERPKGTVTTQPWVGVRTRARAHTHTHTAATLISASEPLQPPPTNLQPGNSAPPDP